MYLHPMGNRQCNSVGHPLLVERSVSDNGRRFRYVESPAVFFDLFTPNVRSGMMLTVSAWQLLMWLVKAVFIGGHLLPPMAAYFLA